MRKTILKNGLTIIHEKKQGNSCMIQVMIKVGSLNELPSQRGLAHFLEHALFEGTIKRPSNTLITSQIEKVGGDFNAYTTNTRTCFYIKVLKKHFPLALDILADILQNPLFKQEHIQREKRVVLKEIDMIKDEPSYYQWILMQQNLFKTYSCGLPTHGDPNVIKALTPSKVRQYFQQYYRPSNMVITTIGDIPAPVQQIKKAFNQPSSKTPKSKNKTPTLLKRSTTHTVKKDISNTRIIISHRTLKRAHKDSLVLDIINAILGRGQSGKLFVELRTKRGLAYEVGTQHVAETSFGYFATYLAVDKKNTQLATKLVKQQYLLLQSITPQDLKEAKTFIEGEYLLEIEEITRRVDQLLFWEHIGDANMLKSYIKKIKQVTLQDVRRVAKKYLTYHKTIILQGR